MITDTEKIYVLILVVAIITAASFGYVMGVNISKDFILNHPEYCESIIQQAELYNDYKFNLSSDVLNAT